MKCNVCEKPVEKHSKEQVFECMSKHFTLKGTDEIYELCRLARNRLGMKITTGIAEDGHSTVVEIRGRPSWITDTPVLDIAREVLLAMNEYFNPGSVTKHVNKRKKVRVKK